MDNDWSGHSTDAARNKLVDLAQRLEGALGDVDRGFVYLSENDADFLVRAMNAFLSGKSASLDSAFGIMGKRGRPKSGPQTAEKMALVKAAIKSSAETWDGVAAEPAVLDLTGPNGIDADVLRKLVNRHRAAAEHEIIDEMAKEIAANQEKKDAQRQERWRAEREAKVQIK